MTKPDSPCCPEMSNLINTRPICLCQLLAKPSDFGISDINSSRALELPSLCKLVKGSPVGLCEGKCSYSLSRFRYVILIVTMISTRKKYKIGL
ncbi:hypothetical protein PHJA_001902500 [Phtheirospermum japonicum]|uniref:Bifunctional inhibitor/plant lipid transfer protein/seed storage helical domain-containing protein n=1 Tax=Phtheirospermum japonicum TaxID=374723 RepID=A0A830CMY0_9LAMI|nr:hypothetical protein PHJA_001902500 [Phtheirospermum japonicum]